VAHVSVCTIVGAYRLSGNPSFVNLQTAGFAAGATQAMADSTRGAPATGGQTYYEPSTAPQMQTTTGVATVTTPAVATVTVPVVVKKEVHETRRR
jgi:hypothetical protein